MGTYLEKKGYFENVPYFLQLNWDLCFRQFQVIAIPMNQDKNIVNCKNEKNSAIIKYTNIMCFNVIYVIFYWSKYKIKAFFLSAADVKMETPILAWSLKSSILSSTCLQRDKTFWEVVSAAVEQCRCKASLVVWGDEKFDPWGWPQYPSKPKQNFKKKLLGA